MKPIWLGWHLQVLSYCPYLIVILILESSFLYPGVGYAAMVMAFWLNIWYIMPLVWAVFYLFSSFRSSLLWATCDNPWNTENCGTIPVTYYNCTEGTDWWFTANSSAAMIFNNCSVISNGHYSSSVREFWEWVWWIIIFYLFYLIIVFRKYTYRTDLLSLN